MIRASLVAVSIGLLLPAVAGASSGSITSVRPAAGGELTANFSTTSTDCSGTGFCGWYPYAHQAAAGAPCSTSSGELIYVGQYQSNPGTQAATDSFFPTHNPVKLCLILAGPLGDQVIAETTYTIPPPPGPTLASPADGARITAGGAVTFKVNARSDDLVSVVISNSPATGADGTLTSNVDSGSAYADTFNGTTYSFQPFSDWSDKPGTYYWQAYRFACTTGSTDCYAESAVRRLVVVPRPPPPFRLRASARTPQRLKSPGASRFNNLVHQVRCSRACTLVTRARAYYRSRGRLVPVSGSSSFDRDSLRGGRSYTYGWSFTRAARARLNRVMHAHGALLWKLRFAATARDGSVRRASARVRMLPQPLPRPNPPRAPKPPVSGCDPSYPTVCIPSPPPDLDCDQVPYDDFAVRGSDPHGFDNDSDGVGCET